MCIFLSQWAFRETWPILPLPPHTIMDKEKPAKLTIKKYAIELKKFYVNRTYGKIRVFWSDPDPVSECEAAGIRIQFF